MNAKEWFIDAQSRIWDIDPDYIRALLRVESGGAGFKDGRLIIRFEAHVFDSIASQDDLYDRVLKYNLDVPWTEQYWRPDRTADWIPLHVSQDYEWQALQFFRTIDDSAALRSTSMGAGQVMGFNHGNLGYASVQEMMDAFSDPETGELDQIAGVFAYLYRVGAVTALQGANWTRVAALYNGSGQVGFYAGLFMNALDSIRREKVAT